MISFFLSTYIMNLSHKLPSLQFLRKYPITPLPYPLKNTIVTVGMNGAKAVHSAISKTGQIEMSYDFSFDIYANTAQDCFLAFDSLVEPLMVTEGIPPFDELVLGEIYFDSATHIFTLPLSARLKMLLKEEEI